MNPKRIAAACTLVALGACSAANPAFAPGGSLPQDPAASRTTPGGVRVRFIEGAPFLQTKINGVVSDIGTASLSVNGLTVVSVFSYGYLSQFVPVAPGVASLKAFSRNGYVVGPFKSPPLAAGKNYTVALVGSYGKYRVLAFEEPKASSSAALSVYEASPHLKSTDFGSFKMANCGASQTGFQKVGSVAFGSVATVALGSRVSGIGGYAGRGTKPLPGGSLAPCQIDAFDRHNAVPFHNAARLSLFVLDPLSGSTIGPVIGSLDP